MVRACGSRGLPPCDPGEYCDYDGADTPDACGATDAGGVCRIPPDACDDVYAPVCGCDGVTYGNACEAALAGASILRTGECEGPVMDCRSTGCDGDTTCQLCWTSWVCLSPDVVC